MKYISADYIKAIMKGDRLMQGNCEYELWKQEVDKKVDAMPSIEVMDVVMAYQQGWCDALDASINALNDAKSQLGNADQHVQRVEYVGNDEKSRCWTCEHFESMHETPISSDGKYYTYVICTASECRYEPKDEPQTERLCDKCEYYKSGEICGHPSIGDPDMGGRGDTFSWIKETPEWCPLKPQTDCSWK